MVAKRQPSDLSLGTKSINRALKSPITVGHKLGRGLCRIASKTGWN